MEIVVRDIIVSEKVQQERVIKQASGVGSSSPAIDAERASDMAPSPYIPLSTLATTGATTFETVLTSDGTNAEKNGAQAEGSYDDRV